MHERDHKPTSQGSSDWNNNLDRKTQREVFDKQEDNLTDLIENKTLWNMFQSDQFNSAEIKQ